MGKKGIGQKGYELRVINKGSFVWPVYGDSSWCPSIFRDKDDLLQGKVKVFPAPVRSQVLLVKNIQYVRLPCSGVVHPEPHHC